MSNSINFSFQHRATGVDDQITASINKRNGVLDFKSILIKAEDGVLDNAQLSEQEAVRQLIATRSGAVDFLSSRQIFNLLGFPAGTDATTAARLVFDAELKGEKFALLPQAVPTTPMAAAVVAPPNPSNALMSQSFVDATKAATKELADRFGLFDLKDFPKGTTSIQALDFMKAGYTALAKAELEKGYSTSALATVKQFADDYPALKRLFSDVNMTQPKPNVELDFRALQLQKENDAAKAALTKQFAVDYDKLQPAPVVTAISMLRNLRGEGAPTATEDKATVALLESKAGSKAAYESLAKSFPQGTTPSQIKSYWMLTTPNFADANPKAPTPPAAGANMENLLNRLAVDKLVQGGVYTLSGFPPKTSALEAWEQSTGGFTPGLKKDVVTPQGPKIEGMAGILKIRTKLTPNTNTTVPPAQQPAQVLKGFEVVDRLVQWRVELKDPSQLAQLSQQGISEAGLRLLTQPIQPVVQP